MGPGENVRAAGDSRGGAGAGGVGTVGGCGGRASGARGDVCGGASGAGGFSCGRITGFDQGPAAGGAADCRCRNSSSRCASRSCSSVNSTLNPQCQQSASISHNRIDIGEPHCGQAHDSTSPSSMIGPVWCDLETPGGVAGRAAGSGVPGGIQSPRSTTRCDLLSAVDMPAVCRGETFCKPARGASQPCFHCARTSLESGRKQP